MAEVKVDVRAGAGGKAPGGDSAFEHAVGVAAQKAQAAADAALSVAAEAELAAYAAGEAHQRVNAVVSVSTPSREEAGAEATRPPVSLSLVLDKSGSMSGEPLRLVKATTDFIITQLDSKDALGVVAYDSEVSEVTALEPCTARSKDSAKQQVKRIQSGSTTNLSGGLFKGIDQQLGSAGEHLEGQDHELHASPPALLNAAVDETAQLAASMGWWCCPKILSSSKSQADTDHSSEGTGGSSASKPASDGVVRAVFLMTDGQANQGVTDAPTLTKITSGMLERGGGKVRVHTFGFGSGHNEGLLGELAEAGGGSYSYMESEEAIPAVFAEALGGLMSMAVQNCEVTLVPQPGVSISAVRTDYKQDKPGDGSVRLQVGDMYAEERKDLVLELSLAPCQETAAQPVLRVSTRFLDVSNGVMVEQSTLLTLARPNKLKPEDLNASELVRWHVTRMAAAEAMDDAQRLADDGNLKEGRERLELMRNRLQNLELADTAMAECRDSLATDVSQVMEKFSDMATYGACGKKRANAMKSKHARQRACSAWRTNGEEVILEQRSTYSNSMQVLLKSKMAFHSSAP